MAIPQDVKQNFGALANAFKSGDVCIMECLDTETGKPVVLICAMEIDGERGVDMVPIAVMIEDNPYARYAPPDPDSHDGFRTGGRKPEREHEAVRNPASDTLSET